MSALAERLPSLTGMLGRELNPVLVRELRSRFRGPRAFYVLVAFLGLLALVVTLRTLGVYGASRYGAGYGGAARSAEIGRGIFMWITAAELFFLAIAVPAITFNAINGEKERRTYELLMATPLSGWSILLGKFGAAMAYVLLLMASALPMMSIAFLFGGVTAASVLSVQALMGVAGMLFAAIGLCASAVASRSGRAAVTAYLGAAAVVFLPMLYWAFFGLVNSLGGYSAGGIFESELILGLLLELSPLAAIVLISEERAEPFLFQSMLAQSWLVCTLLAITGAKIRRDDGLLLRIAGVLTLWLWAWAAWVLVDNPL